MNDSQSTTSIHRSPHPMSVRDRIASYTRPLIADELAEALGITPGQVYRSARRKGGVPSFRIGKNVRFDPAKVCAWYEAL